MYYCCIVCIYEKDSSVKQVDRTLCTGFTKGICNSCRHPPSPHNTVKRVTAECRYQYTKEPLSDITCNPYTSPHQRMDCNFLITSADFQIQWLYMVPGGVEPVLLGMSRHSILLNGIARLESYLVVSCNKRSLFMAILS